jgi:hypothetical protein
VSARDKGFEEAFFDAAERQAGLWGLGAGEAAATRLDVMNERHGDRWLELPLKRFVSEIRAEGQDLLGWPVLMAQRLMADGAGDDCSLEARLILQAIAAHGVQVERLLRQLQAALE